MLDGKGIGPFVAFVLVVAISVAGMAIVLRIGNPLLDKSEDFSKVTEAKGTMNQINSAVKEVSYEGNGSSRKLGILSSGGIYRADSTLDTITYRMDSEYELFSPGMSKAEGDLLVEFFPNNTLVVSLNFTGRGVDITNDERWGEGRYSLMVRNGGYSSGENKISVEVI